MVRTITLALVGTALAAAAAPALAQSGADQQRWDAAQARYRAETERYYAERDRYFASRRGGYGNYGGGYGAAPPPPPPPGPPPGYGQGYDQGYRQGASDDRYENGYDPSRYYRPGGQERVLGADDRVYAGSDGRYYCKRSDGTTGLIAGAAGGGLLGNIIDGGHSRAAGTLLGAAAGALAGRAIDRSSQQVRCQ